MIMMRFSDRMKIQELFEAGQNNANTMRLPSESARAAEELYNKAIGIVEEITGEKWEFSFLTV